MSTYLNDLLSVKDLMRALGVSRQLVYNYIHAGMPSIWWKGRRFDLAEIEKWAKEHPNFLKASAIKDISISRSRSV
jgi:predicted DNA-binding transcriptional regulator AlpA